jgi:hypothetical protein
MERARAEWPLVIAMSARNDETLRRWAGYVPDYASRQVISGGVLYLALSKEEQREKKETKQHV